MNEGYRDLLSAVVGGLMGYALAKTKLKMNSVTFWVILLLANLVSATAINWFLR